jgi:hypothetical protein
MPIKIESHPGATAVFTITNPNSSTPRSITLPDASTTLVGTDAIQTLTNKTISGGTITRDTEKTLSGTTTEFTDIPSWAKRITVMLSGLSTNGTDQPTIQIGSGTYAVTGYTSTASSSGGNVSLTTGFILTNGHSAADIFSGSVQLVNVYGNVWIESGVCFNVNGAARPSSGIITLSGTLDRLRITTNTSVNTFDAGFANVFYE